MQPEDRVAAKTKRTAATLMIVAIMIGAFPLLLHAGVDQIGPQGNVIVISDEAGKEISIGTMLRVEYDDKTGIVNRVGYELENQTEGTSFIVEKIRVRNGHDEKWLQSPAQAIAGKTKGAWEYTDEPLKNAAALRPDLEVQLQLSAGGKFWVLHWKPDKTGSAATWSAPGQW
jgi:hypothetical protein